MSQQFIGYQKLLAVRKSTTNGTYGSRLDCWVVPSETTFGGLGTYLHDDGNVYNCLERSSISGSVTNYASTGEFKSTKHAFNAAVEYCKRHGFVYGFALSNGACYNLDGSNITENESQTMEFI